MSLSSRKVIRALEADGWIHFKTKGDHHHFKHPVKPGKVTVPHPDKDLKKGTIRNIERQSGIRLLS